MGNRRKQITFEVDERGCHICTSHAVGKHGYPYYHADNQRWTLNRYVYAQAHGPIPHGLVVRHKCDVRKCINIEHLEIGTYAQNTADMMERGRCRSPKGEDVTRAKLTDAKVREIRASPETIVEIGRRYGIHHGQVSRIKNRKAWAHVCP